jgi:hypothetical protein
MKILKGVHIPMTENKTENTVPNIWEAQENTIYLYKIISLTLGAVLVSALGFIAISYFKNPIVIVQSPDKIEYYPSLRKTIEVGKPEVESFTKEFLTALYVWPDYNADRLKKEIAPFVEEELLGKLIDAQNQKYEKDLKGKKLSQAITFIEIEVLGDKVVARFDRILKLEGVPLVVPTEITLNMLKGSSSHPNPMGIYITGVTENEGAK